MIKKEDAIAYCALNSPPDDDSLTFIAGDELIIRNKHHDKIFLLEHVLGIGIDKKVLLLPTIAGGVVAPLFMVAGFNGLGNLWLMICISFAGLLALYFGLSGSDALIIRTKAKEFDFFVSFVNPKLAEFCALINQILLPARKNQLFCHLPQQTQADQNGILKPPPEGLEITTFENITRKPITGTIIQLISPINQESDFTYEYSDGKIQARLHSELTPADFHVVNRY